MDEILHTPQKTRRLWLWGAVAALVLAGVWLALKTITSPPAIATGTVRFAQVQHGVLDISVNGFGQFVSNETMAQILPFNGIVQQVFKHNGDRVEPGDVVMQLMNPDLEADIAAKEASIRLAELARQEAVLALEKEQQELTMRLQQAESNYRIEQLQLEANEILYQQNIVSRLQYAQQEAKTEMQAQQLKATQADFNRFEQQHQQRLAIEQEKINTLQQELNTLQGHLLALTVEASRGGVISHLSAEAGRQVPASQVLFLINSEQPNLARIRFPQSRQNVLRPGLAVTATIPGRSFKGEIVRVNPIIVDGYIEVEAQFSDSLEGTRVDMSLRAEAIINSLPEVTYVPLPSYVQGKPDHLALFIKENNRLLKQEVSVQDVVGDFLLLEAKSLIGKEVVISDIAALLRYPELTLKGN